MANLQLQWASRDPYVANVEGYVSPANYNSQYPANSLQKAGAVLTSGSDFPIDAIAPFQQIETAVDRLNDDPANLERWPGPLSPDQAITLDQSLMMHTIGSAYGLFQEDRTGSIDVGKDADLIVLDQNLYDVPIGDVSDTQVMLTMTRGKIVSETPDAATFDAVGAQVDAAQPQFPVQSAGTIGPIRTVTVTAGGDRTLKIGDVSLNDDVGSEGDFLMTSENCSNRSFAPGESCNVRLRFAPAKEAFTSTSAIVLGANISGNEHQVPLTAQSAPKPADPVCPTGKVGTPPNCTDPVKDPADLSGSSATKALTIKQGKSGKITVSVKNSGESDATDVNVCTTIAKPFATAANCVPVGMVAAGASKTVKMSIKLGKKAKGKRTATTKITSSVATRSLTTKVKAKKTNKTKK